MTYDLLPGPDQRRPPRPSRFRDRLLFCGVGGDPLDLGDLLCYDLLTGALPYNQVKKLMRVLRRRPKGEAELLEILDPQGGETP